MCDAEQFICQIKNKLALPIWYKASQLVAEEALYSTRYNSYVTARGEAIQQLADTYKTKYDNSVKHLLSGVKTPENVCWSCFKSIEPINQVP
jgi:hypothetical protein